MKKVKENPTDMPIKEENPKKATSTSYTIQTTGEEEICSYIKHLEKSLALD